MSVCAGNSIRGTTAREVEIQQEKDKPMGNMRVSKLIVKGIAITITSCDVI